jgi:hypothetical protein
MFLESKENYRIFKLEGRSLTTKDNLIVTNPIIKTRLLSISELSKIQMTESQKPSSKLEEADAFNKDFNNRIQSAMTKSGYDFKKAFFKTNEILPIKKSGLEIARETGGTKQELEGSELASIDVEPKKLEKLKLEFKAEEIETPSIAESNDKDDTLDSYDMTSSEISRGDSKTIFQIISHRYMKSAYPRLLEEIK